ncbi:hypothetical protein [Ornithinimicrobium sp. Y1694]|uniref:hypothetical protein n=1 Tax=Ornithinimicrobium sp. Y1694 TaxID=3418590 RepID=UPI003CEFF6FF
MGRIKGHYVWDDDHLTPGQKKEGGLHQNLFDSGGNLRGSARFIPDDGNDPEPLIITETVYIPADERRRTEEDEEFQMAVAALVVQLIGVGVSKGLPLVEQWWRETARPVVQAKRAAFDERRSRRKGRRKTAPSITEAGLSHDANAVSVNQRPQMSSAEAQARYLAAVAARAYSDEQMRLVANSTIVDGEGHSDLPRLLKELPPDQVKALIEQMVRNPHMLGEDTLADLASVLGRPALERHGVEAELDRR